MHISRSFVRPGSIMLMLLAPLCGSASGQTAFFSATGTFSQPSGESHDFLFNIPSSADMLFRTWAWGGGTNAAGQMIASGGIDSILSLYTGGGSLLDFNDDIGPGQRDSRIIAPALPAGSYRLELTNFKFAAGNGSWAVDLVNETGNLTLTAATGSANSTMHTLAFGGADGGIATLPIDASTSPTITAGLIVLPGGMTSITGTGAVTFSGPINGSSGGLEIPTGVTAHFTGAVNGLGAFSGGGVKEFELTAAGGNLATTGSTIVAPGASLSAAHVRESSLTVEGTAAITPNGTDAGTSRLNELTLAGSASAWIGELDLANNALVIDYSSGQTPYTIVQDQIRFASSNTMGGIRTSLGTGYAVGYAEASALATVPPIFGTVDDDTLLVRGTRLGDANLDGIVNLADFNRLAGNFGATGVDWSRGDFNHDGVVNLTDFNRLAGNFGLAATGRDGPTSADWANLAAVVPEPTLLALAGVAASASMMRRSRR